mmetsp:Transcript_48926/g.124131  ORF Transcript_48926/g.124131 Transcript_48926/m.124131 type:complete len:212 (-) Transcript_48926:31-666(-)
MWQSPAAGLCQGSPRPRCSNSLGVILADSCERSEMERRRDWRRCPPPPGTEAGLHPPDMPVPRAPDGSMSPVESSVPRSHERSRERAACASDSSNSELATEMSSSPSSSLLDRPEESLDPRRLGRGVRWRGSSSSAASGGPTGLGGSDAKKRGRRAAVAPAAAAAGAATCACGAEVAGPGLRDREGEDLEEHAPPPRIHGRTSTLKAERGS